MRKMLTKLTLALSLTLGGMASADVAYETQTYGGSSGHEFEDECTYRFTKGLALRTGRVVDRIALRCTDASGQNVETRNVAFGGDGGTAHNTTCKTGFVVKGLRLSSGRLVDRLQLTCVEEADVRKATDTVAQETLDFDYPAFGGDGGSYFSLKCGKGDAAVGIHGAADDKLDRIGLLCKDTGNQ